MLYLECKMGAAGDMLNAALVSLVDRKRFVDKMNSLKLPGTVVELKNEYRNGIYGNLIKVVYDGEEEESEAKFFAKYEKIARQYNDKGNGVVGALSVNYGKEVDYMRIEDLQKLKDMPFEDTNISMPLTYDEILTQHFGDYMKPAQVPNTHGDVYFSTNIPYETFIEKVKNREIEAEDYLL